MRWSVRHILLAYSVIILMTTVLLVGVVAYLTGKYAVEYLAQKTMSRQSQQLQEYTQSLLDSAIRPSRILSERLQPPPDRAQLASLYPEFRRLAHAYPELSYLSLGLEQSGDYIHIHRFSDRHLEEAYYRYQAAGKSLRTDFRLEGEQRIPLTRRVSDFDPRQRPYYVQARTASRAVWTPAYPFRTPSGPPELGVTLATPLKGASGELAGVVSADFTLASLTRYLRNLPLSVNSTLCLIEEVEPGRFRIIAHTNPKLVGKPIDDDPALAMAVRAIPLEQLQEDMQLATASGFLVSGAMLKRPDDPPWRIYGLTPQTDLMTPVYRSVWIGLGIALTGLLGAVWLSFRVARQITVPLTALTEQAEHLGERAFDATPGEPSHVTEINRLQEAILRMQARLQRQLSNSPAPESGSPTTIAVLAFDTQSIGLYRQNIAEAMGRFTPLIQERGSILQRGSFELVALWNEADQIEAAYRALQQCQALVRTWSGATSSPLLIALHHDPQASLSPGELQRLPRRLTTLNSVYGTQILITEALLQHPEAAAFLLTRPVETIRLESGETTLIREVLGLRREADETLLRVAELGEAFMECYLARDFVGAEEQARASLALRPNDPLMRRHLASALDFQRVPPPATWDGSRTL
jgi:adenylate cyclase